MDSDDEEQTRRLQALEYQIGHRPSQQELIEKKILYKKTTDMAPSLQYTAKKLQNAMEKHHKIESNQQYDKDECFVCFYRKYKLYKINMKKKYIKSY